MASTYRRIAAEEEYDDLDYWKIAEATDPGAFIRPGDSIHPGDLSIAIMLDWVLEKLFRWETYGSVLTKHHHIMTSVRRLIFCVNV